MKLTHVWICGRWVWRVLTLRQFDALPHLTQKMILAKAAKLAISGGVLVCAGTGAWVGPRLIGGGSSWHGDTAGYRRVVATPEPSGLLVMVVGIGGVLVIRRRTKP